MMNSVILLLVVFAGIAFGRTIYSGEDPLLQYAWVGSTKYPKGQVPSGATQNLLAIVMGHAVPGTLIPTPPYISVTFAEGKDTVTATGDQFQGAVTGLIWAYSDLGEYCETNGVPGYQPFEDTLIHFNTWYEAIWNPMYAGVNNNNYYATLNDSTGTFTFSCRVSADSRTDSGLTVDPYTLKCDVTVDATNYWAPVTSCPDSSRYIALLAYLVGVKIDDTTNGTLNQADSTGQTGITLDSAKSFFKWKTSFEDKISGQSYDVNAQLINSNGTMPNSPTEATDVKIVIFSFLSPKSQTNVFFWDPTMGVNGAVVDPATSSTTATSTASSTQVVYAFISLILVLCAML